MIIVDVGANVGVYSRFFATLTKSGGIVHCFEPSPLNFERLRDNIAHLTNVRSNQAAVGDRSGTLSLYLSDELNVDHRAFGGDELRDSITVQVVSLDDYFAVGQRVDLIKIDVQGFEMNVLRGAARVLAENQNIVVMMEYWPYGLRKASIEPQEPIALLRDLGFEVRTTIDTATQKFDFTALDPKAIDDDCNLLVSRSNVQPKP
ncbi:FkbM family methyltransferase [Bradyrhizobium ivorense]|uniref:FkbM family methyltransferase n=1 Tax=Bradyrhizobium ivorense TaxID=2511166 RepID=UPI001FCF2507|nr:FkbM family methyltransferase [Bradyrhizobium ivorense]